MKPVMMAGEDTVPREGSYRQFFDNKRMVAFRYIIKPNFDSSIEPRKRDLTAAREFHSEPSTVQGGRRLRDAGHILQSPIYWTICGYKDLYMEL
jgi:hypothetical protein